MRMDVQSNDWYRGASLLFSTSFKRKVLSENGRSELSARIDRHRPRKSRGLSRRTQIEAIYKQLSRAYRNEYVYKNELFERQILLNHGIGNATLINEFRVEKSIADFVLLNGEIQIFEIKSDLDNLDKLQKQIQDYKTFADRVTIVTSEKHASRLISVLKGGVGIEILKDNLDFEVAVPSRPDSSGVTHRSLFKALRKSEYLSLVEMIFGSVPQVPNTRINQTCFEIVSGLSVSDLSFHVRELLKLRTVKCPELLISKRVPSSLRHILYVSNPTAKQYQDVLSFLESKE